jgi:hypothetical protein
MRQEELSLSAEMAKESSSVLSGMMEMGLTLDTHECFKKWTEHGCNWVATLMARLLATSQEELLLLVEMERGSSSVLV